MEQKYSSVVRWILYILSFFSIVVGLVAGILLWTRDDAESKQVGKNCLIAMVLGIVLWCVCYLLMMVMGIGSAMVPSSMLLLSLV
ncbi:MAG: hypothetical protein KKA73_14350 [Chloroflexi bacterium]|nr:hypothetical protein [Chloroflexota bacterium]MBU1748867.1 hypothetical protein [Chloroflexota bacterium]MBU1880174.1 hypothetical protein [Chloroflexota bacterium]